MGLGMSLARKSCFEPSPFASLWMAPSSDPPAVPFRSARRLAVAPRQLFPLGAAALSRVFLLPHNLLRLWPRPWKRAKADREPGSTL